VALNSHWKWHMSLDALIIISSRISWWITSASRMSRGGTSGQRVFVGGNILCNCVVREKKKYVYLMCEVGEAKRAKTQVGLLMTTWSFISSRKQSIPTTASSVPEPRRQNTKSNVDCLYLCRVFALEMTGLMIAPYCRHLLLAQSLLLFDNMSYNITSRLIFGVLYYASYVMYNFS